eukprot:scaffold1949_cov176-Ochromonas_danica.AAC.7
MEFTTYDQKPVDPCDDPNQIYYDASDQTSCNFSTASIVNVGVVYNDVWAYRLCNSSSGERDYDDACVSNGWELWHQGAKEGGCAIELGIEVCTVPSERYNHGSVLFDDGCLYVYGGFSQRCEDYCDDLWFFDIYLRSWREVYSTGTLTNFYTDTFFDETITLNVTDVPRTNSSSAFAGPSKRWRHSMVAGKAYYDASDGYHKQKIAIYGGHRLWQGYSPENSYENNWASYITRPVGGYLDDLWIYTKYLDFSYPGEGYRANNGLWTIKEPKEQCYSDPGLSWSSRNDIACVTVKPTGRAGHGSAFDSEHDIIWIFGGYTSYYPYLSTDGIGSGAGVSSVGSGGFIPYPGYDYFRNDLWYYNLSSSLWTEVVPPDDSPVPDGRVDMVFLLLEDNIIFMHGGYSDNYIYGDTWYFNITSSRWLEKTHFVHPIYPSNCTDDWEYIAANNCTSLVWPKELERESDYPYSILPYSQQPYYWPKTDSSFAPYFGIFDKSWSTKTNKSLSWDNQAASGTPVVPYAATGPLQSVLHFVYELNSTHNATIYEYCTSVYAEPTRGTTLDGKYGRANASIFIAQPRRQRPGWDGCRDRADDRTDLTATLQYKQPLPRHSHRAIFYPNTSEILFYGGMAYLEEQPISGRLNHTYSSSVSSEMWYYNLYHCVNNCSNHGYCYYGYCYCDVGYYGLDCSNTSCPGTWCYYDEITHEQVCKHGCHAGYLHQDNDIYHSDVAKLACSKEHPGESHGICDGYGTTMCAPPFITSDCSVKDCKSNCSFNGYCSVEYPVSRCLCQPGYFGEICDKMVCLNNCTYPNGICNTTTGSCVCNMMYSPYNNKREYKPWAGEDCSYLFPYAAAGPVRHHLHLPGCLWTLWISTIIGFVVMIMTIFTTSSSNSYEDDGHG